MTSAEDSFFVVIEGLDGSGKTQVSRRVKEILLENHHPDEVQVGLTFEPHDPSTAGLFIRQVLTNRLKTTPVALAFAFALNRLDHNERTISPFLEQDAKTVMICDRYYLSSLVYQSVDPLTMEEILELNQWARRPDLTIFLNVSANTGYARMRKRTQKKEMFEKHLDLTHSNYMKAIKLLRTKGDKIVEVDANYSFPEVVKKVLSVIKENSPSWLKSDIQIQHTFFDAKEEIELESNFEDYHPKRSTILEDLFEYWKKTSIKLSFENALQDLYMLTKVTVARQAYENIVRLFFAYLDCQNYKIGDRLPWTETLAYEMEYEMPFGMYQRGVALLLKKSQQIDEVTRKVQNLVNNIPQFSEMGSLTDFMFVLNITTHDINPNFYEREIGNTDTRPKKPLSPNIKILNQKDIVDLLFIDVLKKDKSVYISDTLQAEFQKLDMLNNLKGLPSTLHQKIYATE